MNEDDIIKGLCGFLIPIDAEDNNAAERLSKATYMLEDHPNKLNLNMLTITTFTGEEFTITIERGRPRC